MTKASMPHATTSADVHSRAVDIALEYVGKNPHKAAAIMAAAGVHFRVIVRVVSEPSLRRRHRRD